MNIFYYCSCAGQSRSSFVSITMLKKKICILWYFTKGLLPFFIFQSPVLTCAGAVAVAPSSGWWWIWIHRSCIFILRAARLDRPQVAVAARAEARGSRQIKSLHCLWFPSTIGQWVATALPTNLKKRVYTHTLRTQGTLIKMHSLLLLFFISFKKMGFCLFCFIDHVLIHLCWFNGRCDSKS